MNLLRTFCALLCFGLSRNFVKPADWVDSLTRYIVVDSKARQVVLMTNLVKNEKSFSPRIEQIFGKLMENLPTLRMNMGDLEEWKNSMPNDARDNFNPIDASATVYIFVHESRDTLPILPSNRFIDVAVNMSTFPNEPKFLLLFFTRALTDDLEEFLRYAWTMKILDFTIVELSEPEENNLLSADRTPDEPIIHRFDPFKNLYTRIKWTPEILWFPNKADNMRNYPVRTRVPNAPPFSFARFDEYGKVVKVGGPTIRLVETIARKLNFSLIYFQKARAIDFVSAISPDWSDGSAVTVKLRTATVKMDELCPIVPILPKIMAPSINFFIAYLLFFGTVIIIWIYGRVFRFHGYLWKPFFIARVLFGISVTRQPIANTERVIFACLLALATIYSSTIYSAVTDISLGTNTEMEFNSFEDHVNSGLTPMINPHVFDSIYAEADGALLNLKKKSVKGVPRGSYGCPFFAADHKNITCVMTRRYAAIAIASSRRDGRARIKVAKPCFGQRGWALEIGDRSLYLSSSIDSVIHRMQSAGLVDKFYEDHMIALSKTHGDHEKSMPERKQNMAELRHLLKTILITGYALSLFAFVVEIILHRALKYRKMEIGTVE